MGKICPQCNTLFSKLANFSIISGFNSPKDGDKFCVECGTELIDSSLEVTATCPDCGELRREKGFEIGAITTIDPNTKYVKFCHKCSHKF